MPRGIKSEFDPTHVRDISERVYRIRLCEESGKDADKRMTKKDGDKGEQLRGRAAAYDALTRAYLKVMNG